MSKTTSKYPSDEFDQVDPNALPAGVHRTPPSRWSLIGPYIAVFVICAALGVAAIYFVSQSPSSPISDKQSPSASVTETPDPEAEQTDPGDAVVDPGTEDPGTETLPGDGEPEPTEEQTEPAVPVDQTTAVRVLNATGRNGVAKDAAQLLLDAGWTDVTADTFADEKPAGSLVYYKGAENEAAAREVAGILGITEVVEVEVLRAPVSAVLVGDYGK